MNYPSNSGAVEIIAVVYSLDVLILWLLSKLGDGIKADVKMKFTRSGSTLWIASAGLLGAFLAIAILSFAAIYFFSS